MAPEAGEEKKGLEDAELQHLKQGHEKAQAPKETEQSKDPSKALDQVLALLKSRNDTNRFVALALLKSILDNKVDFQKDSEIIMRCWAAIPASFLEGLLRAPLVKGRSKEESQHMVELAIAVLHAFIVLLPDHIKNDAKCLGRLGGIATALDWSSPDTKTQIFQIMLTLASTDQGSLALMSTDVWPQLVNSASQNQLALDVIKYAYINMSPFRLEDPEIRKEFNEMIGKLINNFQKSPDCFIFFQMLQEVFNAFPIGVLFISSPPWLSSLAGLIRQSCVGRPRLSVSKNRKPAVLLTASLLHFFPSSFPSLLFSEASKPPIPHDSKPLTHLFVKLLLIEIRSTVPYFHESVRSNDVSMLDGLAASYDIITAFIGFLIQLLDDDSPDHEINPSSALLFPPSFLLQLRADISEAMSITIEHLRDHLDTFSSQSCAPKIITSSPIDANSSRQSQEPLTLSQLRTLALWLREDDNDALRKEAASITNIFLTLYAVQDPTIQFRSPVLIALEGTLAVPEGIEAFLTADGWTVLVRDLRAILASADHDASTIARGIDIVRVLLTVVESDVVGPAKEDWMELITLVTLPPLPTSNKNNNTAVPDPSSAPTLEWDLRIALAQLAVELLIRAPRNVRRRWMGAAGSVLAMATLVAARGDLSEEVRDGAGEVVQGLVELGVGE